jgi:putative membrane protein
MGGARKGCASGRQLEAKGVSKMLRTWSQIAGLALVVCAPAFAADVVLDDSTFVRNAAQAGIAEVELSRLALATSRDPDVRAFAERMVADHEKANEELSSLAAEGKVSMPTSPDSDEEVAISELKGKTGADFDEDYAKRMAADHVKAVALFRAAAQSRALAPALAQYAKRTLPTLEHHQKMAEELADETD